LPISENGLGDGPDRAAEHTRDGRNERVNQQSGAGHFLIQRRGHSWIVWTEVTHKHDGEGRGPGDHSAADRPREHVLRTALDHSVGAFFRGRSGPSLLYSVLGSMPSARAVLPRCPSCWRSTVSMYSRSISARLRPVLTAAAFQFWSRTSRGRSTASRVSACV